MSQVISNDLKGYLTCCASGLPTDVSNIPLYLFFSNIIPVIRSQTKIAYNHRLIYQPSRLTKTYMESIALPNFPILELIFQYSTPTINKGCSFSPICSSFLDTTSSEAFWNDVNGFIYANNLPDLIYEPLTDRYRIDSFNNNVYIAIDF